MTTQNRTLEQVEERMSELQSGVLTQGPAAEGFNEGVLEYAALINERATLKVQQNEGLIATAKEQLGVGIETMITSLGLSELKMEPITQISWKRVQADDGTVTYEVGVNVAPPAPRAARAPRAPKTNGETQQRDLNGIFEANATPEEQEKMQRILSGYTSTGQEYVDPKTPEGAKKTNSRAWALKNQVANRVEDNTTATA